MDHLSYRVQRLRSSDVSYALKRLKSLLWWHISDAMAAEFEMCLLWSSRPTAFRQTTCCRQSWLYDINMTP